MVQIGPIVEKNMNVDQWTDRQDERIKCFPFVDTEKRIKIGKEAIF